MGGTRRRARARRAARRLEAERPAEGGGHVPLSPALPEKHARRRPLPGFAGGDPRGMRLEGRRRGSGDRPGDWRPQMHISMEVLGGGGGGGTGRGVAGRPRETGGGRRTIFGSAGRVRAICPPSSILRMAGRGSPGRGWLGQPDPACGARPGLPVASGVVGPGLFGAGGGMLPVGRTLTGQRGPRFTSAFGKPGADVHAASGTGLTSRRRRPAGSRWRLRRSGRATPELIPRRRRPRCAGRRSRQGAGGRSPPGRRRAVRTGHPGLRSNRTARRRINGQQGTDAPRRGRSGPGAMASRSASERRRPAVPAGRPALRTPRPAGGVTAAPSKQPPPGEPGFGCGGHGACKEVDKGEAQSKMRIGGTGLIEAIGERTCGTDRRGRRNAHPWRRAVGRRALRWAASDRPESDPAGTADVSGPSPS